MLIIHILQQSTKLICNSEGGHDSETVEHFILHCPKYDSK